MTRLLAWLGRLLCARRGHDYMLEVTRTHLALRCASCGQATPGWRVR